MLLVVSKHVTGELVVILEKSENRNQIISKIGEREVEASDEENHQSNMAGHHAMEVTKTVLEVADVAWTAVEAYHHHHHNHHSDEGENHDESTNPITDPRDRELEALRQENRRLRTLLEANLKLFETLAESAALSHDCPKDVSITN